MTLDVRRKKRNGTTVEIVSLVECPACGADLGLANGSRRVYHLLNDHGPEDFGLRPLGEG